MTILNSGQDLYIRKGDTGQVEFRGLPTDKTYTAYLSIYDEDTNKKLTETAGVTVVDGSAIIYFSKDFSDSLKVGEWVYALKICATVDILGVSEDTILPRSYIDDSGNLVNEPAPRFTVDTKMAEGVE